MSQNRLSKLMTSTPTEERQNPLSTMPVYESPQTASPDRGRLRKPLPSHARSASANYDGPPQPSLQELQQGMQQGHAGVDYRGVSSPLQPPPVITGSLPGSRASSQDRSRPGTPSTWSRPGTPTIILPDGQSPMTPSSPVAPGGKEHKKKRSLFGGLKNDKDTAPRPFAWIAGHPQRQAYDAESLVSGKPMQEMWDNSPDGNCYIYLFPRNSGKGASFKIDSAVFGASPVLTKLAFGDLYSNNAIQNSGDRRHQMPLESRTQNMSLNDLNTPPATPPQPKRQPGTSDTMTSSSSHDSRGGFSTFSDSPESHLYIPIKFKTDGNVHIPVNDSRKSKDSRDARDPNSDDVQALVDIRNFFAFLCGQALVATERKHSFFHIFMTIAGILGSYEFTNVDGSTFGEVASSSFDSYVAELGLADVRSSREATIEGIVLGERMKSVLLYNEAFTHAAGKHEDLVGLRSPKYELISPITKTRLARAAMDLDKRTDSIRLILNDFEFPFLFIGTMSSKTSDERKEGVRFEAWKSAFLSFRKNYLGILRNRYGNWPPRATSKKNNLETSGLNRSVLRDVYHDMCSIYDLLVDRTNLTSRTVDGVSLDGGAREEPTVRALRAVLSEYDRSSPPVKPPVPFDLPKLPTIKSTRPDFGRDKRADIKAIQKKLKDDEIAKILRASWNDDAFVTPFVDAFREMEKRAAHGCTIPELVDQRIGQWIFMYVVLQALPMLAIDAPSLKWTKGVEYFLCEPPRSGVPWANPNAGAGSGVSRTWFSVGDGGGVVSLPSDVVEHGVEGIYRRSHCWTAAEKWTRENPIMNTALHGQEAMSNTMSPPSTRTSADGLPQPPSSNTLLSPDSRPGSRPSSRQSKRNSSLALGLEALPLPVGVTPDGSAPSGYAPSWAPGQNPGTPGSTGPTGGPFGSPGGGWRAGTPTSERPKSAHIVDSSRTFDAILASVGQDGNDKKKKR